MNYLNEKDKLIFSTILEQEMKEFFISFSTNNNIKNVLVSIYGLNGANLTFDEMKEFFQNELQSNFNKEGLNKEFLLLKNFFHNVYENYLMLEEKNKKLFVFCFSFVFRLYYNYYLLNNLNETLKEDSQELHLLSSRSISLIKGFANDDEDFVSKSFVSMSELIFYFFNFESLDFDDFREQLTHGITGCFILEEDTIKNIKDLGFDPKINIFYDN